MIYRTIIVCACLILSAGNLLADHGFILMKSQSGYKIYRIQEESRDVVEGVISRGGPYTGGFNLTVHVNDMSSNPIDGALVSWSSGNYVMSSETVNGIAKFTTDISPGESFYKENHLIVFAEEFTLGGMIFKFMEKGERLNIRFKLNKIGE